MAYKVTYKDGSTEKFDKATGHEIEDNFVTFSDEDDELVAMIAIDLIKKIE